MPYLILLVFSTININILCGADEALSDSQTQGGQQLHSEALADPSKILKRAYDLKEAGKDELAAEAFVQATGHPEVTPDILRLAAVGTCKLGGGKNDVYRGRAAEIYEQLGHHPNTTYENRFDAGVALDELGAIGRQGALSVFSHIKFLVENDQRKACQELDIQIGRVSADLQSLIHRINEIQTSSPQDKGFIDLLKAVPEKRKEIPILKSRHKELMDRLKTYAERADAALKRINSRSHEVNRQIYRRHMAVYDLSESD